MNIPERERERERDFGSSYKTTQNNNYVYKEHLKKKLTLLYKKCSIVKTEYLRVYLVNIMFKSQSSTNKWLFCRNVLKS